VSSIYRRCEEAYGTYCAVYWAHLSRLTNFLVVLNVSLFFVTGLVKMGYFYTFYSVTLLGVVAVGMLVPTKLIDKLWYYLIFVLLDLTAIYFLVSSIIHWVRMHG